jgi:hypothetical protein
VPNVQDIDRIAAYAVKDTKSVSDDRDNSHLRAPRDLGADSGARRMRSITATKRRSTD